MAYFDDFGTIGKDPYWPYEFFTLRDVVEGFGYELGLDDYPIFDEAYRDELNRKIRDHFWFREVAADTPQRFVFYLNRRMREQMPQINRLYVALRDEDPFFMRSSTTGSTEGTARERSAANADARQVYSDTPQVQLVGGHEDYATTLTGNKSTSDTDATRDNTSTYKTETVTQAGTIVSSAEMWMEGINNADLVVFERLEPLFVQVWHDRMD